MATEETPSGSQTTPGNLGSVADDRKIDFRLFVAMLRFLWNHAPAPSKYLLFPLALLAGLSRDWLMIIINDSAAAPLDVAIHYWLPMFAGAFAIVLCTPFIYHVLSTAVTTSIINEVRLKMIDNLLKAQPTFIDRYQTGGIYHILTTDVGQVANFSMTVLNILPSVIFLSIAIPQLFFYSKMAGVFALLVMIGGTLAYYLQQRVLTTLNTDARLLDVAYFEQVCELLWGTRELRLNMDRRKSFVASVDRILEKLRKVMISVKKIYEIGEGATNALKYALFAGIVFLVPYVVKMESAATFQIITFVLFSLMPFEQIVSSYPSVLATLVSFIRIKALNTDLEPFETIEEHIPQHLPAFSTISFDGVTALPGLREKTSFVLGPFDFTLRHNEVVFLVGHNGSGKSTFMNVLAGLIDVSEGTIAIDDKKLTQDDMAAYRARVSAVFTWFHVFKDLYGLEGISPEKFDETLKRVGLSGMTTIADGKITRMDLSAGQKRRLALAIVLLENRDILILDEFVADQDPEQREYFFRTLLPSLKAEGKTVIVSTHDLHWMDCADRVYKFEQGRMTEITPQKPEAATVMEAATG